MVSTPLAGFEIDFAKSLISVIHERVFKTSTTYPFACMIFKLCSEAGVPIWNCDSLCTPTGTIDITLIRDEANVPALRRGPRLYLQQLYENFADTVELTQG